MPLLFALVHPRSLVKSSKFENGLVLKSERHTFPVSPIGHHLADSLSKSSRFLELLDKAVKWADTEIEEILLSSSPAVYSTIWSEFGNTSGKNPQTCQNILENMGSFKQAQCIRISLGEWLVTILNDLAVKRRQSSS